MPRSKYPEETVQKILDASLQLFLEKGYEKTTILDIVANLGGLTRGAFYHHFKSKEEVLDALMSHLFNNNNSFKEAAKQPGLTGLEKIKHGIVNQYHLADPKFQQLILALMSMVQENPIFLTKMIADNRRFVSLHLQPLIEEGISDGSIQPHNSKLLAELVVVLTNFWMNMSLFPVTEKEAEEKLLFVAEIFELVGIPLLDENVIRTIASADWNLSDE